MPTFVYHNHRIPLAPGQAVGAGWGSRSKPEGVTWHWGVTASLAVLTQVIGGPNAERKGEASAHVGIGSSYREGVAVYVSFDDRSWHAGRNQTLRWDGEPLTHPDDRATRSTIGIELSHMGAVFEGTSRPGTIGHQRCASPLGASMRVAPFPAEQLAMAIEIGREIVARFPHIGPDQHHGHHDICPTDPQGRAYKVDVVGFPFARVLRGIYPGREIYDHWTPTLTQAQRQRALSAAGYPLVADGAWGAKSRAALVAFQRAHGMVPNGCWSTFVSRRLHQVLAGRGVDLAKVAGAAP